MSLTFSFLKKALMIFIYSFAVQAFAKMPDIYCVDANEYWDGAYTIEIDSSQALASIYAQLEEGRKLIASVPVEKTQTQSQLVYAGKDFNLSIELNQPTSTKAYPAQMTFKYPEHHLQEKYVCAFTR